MKIEYKVTLDIRQAYTTVPAEEGHIQEAKRGFEERVKALNEYRGTVATVISLEEVKPPATPPPAK